MWIRRLNAVQRNLEPIWDQPAVNREEKCFHKEEPARHRACLRLQRAHPFWSSKTGVAGEQARTPKRQSEFHSTM